MIIPKRKTIIHFFKKKVTIFKRFKKIRSPERSMLPKNVEKAKVQKVNLIKKKEVKNSQGKIKVSFT